MRINGEKRKTGNCRTQTQYQESCYLCDAFCEGKLHCILKSNYMHSKTHLKSYNIEKCLLSRKSGEEDKLSFSESSTLQVCVVGVLIWKGFFSFCNV